MSWRAETLSNPQVIDNPPIAASARDGRTIGRSDRSDRARNVRSALPELELAFLLENADIDRSAHSKIPSSRRVSDLVAGSRGEGERGVATDCAGGVTAIGGSEIVDGSAARSRGRAGGSGASPGGAAAESVAHQAERERARRGSPAGATGSARAARPLF